MKKVEERYLVGRVKICKSKIKILQKQKIICLKSDLIIRNVATFVASKKWRYQDLKGSWPGYK